MVPGIARLFLSVALSLGCSLTLSCGSSYEVVYHDPPRSSPYPEAPGYVVAQMESCAKQGEGTLASGVYPILIDVNATEDGHVRGVNVKDSMLGGTGIESCVVRALEGTSFPASLTGLRSSRGVSGGLVAPGSRALVGSPLALAAPAVALTPIVIVAAGVTIMVAITLYVVKEVTTSTRTDSDDEKERCRKVKEACIQKCMPEFKKRDHGNSFHKCLKECRDAEGCW